VWCRFPCPDALAAGATRDAGTYGVLTLFGILPCAMAWSARYGSGAGDSGSGSSSSSSKSGGSESSGGSGGALRGEVVELVPGGKPVLVLLAGGAAAIILKESAEAVARLV
jgi:tyrosine-specific transport protein